MRPFWTNCSISEFLILIPGNIRSTSLLSGCSAKIIVPITETIPWISSSQICLNDTSIIVRYNEYDSSSPSALSPYFFNSRIINCTWGSTSRKLATVIAQIKIPAAQGTR